jgi:hypothetical protein
VAWLLGPLAVLVVVVLAGLPFGGYRLVRILAVPVEGDDRPASPGPRLGGELPWRRDHPQGDQSIRRQPFSSPPALLRSLATRLGPAGANVAERANWVETSELPEERKWAERWSRLTERADHQRARPAPAPSAPTGGVAQTIAGRTSTAPEAAPAWTPRVRTQPVPPDRPDPAPVPAAGADSGAQVTSDRRSHTAPSPAWIPGAHVQLAGEQPSRPSSAPPRAAGTRPDHLHHQQVASAAPSLPEPWQWRGPPPVQRPDRPRGRRSEVLHAGLFALPGPLARVPGWLVGVVPALLVVGLLGWLAGPAAMVAVVVVAGLGVAGYRLVRTLGLPGDLGSPDGGAGAAPRRPVAGTLPWKQPQFRSDHGRRQGATTPDTARFPSAGPSHEVRVSGPAGWDRTTQAFQHGPGQPATWRPSRVAGPQPDQGGSSVWSERLEKLPQGCLVSALVAIVLWFAFWAVVLFFALYVLVGGTFP